MSSKARSSTAVKGEKPLRKRKKTMPSPVTGEPATSITSLPYDLLSNCLARVSRLYYPTLSRVSETFRSIVASSELYETRSRLNRTEKCLYLCLHFPCDPNKYWFTLYRKPNRNVTKKSSGYYLVQVPSPNGLLPGQSSSVIAVGSDIYNIGGADSYRYKFGKTRYSSFVSVLDCRNHSWRQVPRMRVERSSASTVSLVDGKIYVGGGCKDINTLNWIEVYDPEAETWGSVTNPRIENDYEDRPRRVAKSLGLEGKLYMFGDEFVVYNSKEDRWNDIGVDRQLCRAIDYRSCINSSSCVIDNVLYIWDKGVFKWYDFKVSLWKDLNGVEGSLPGLRDREYCKMVDLGGKIAVLWEECVYTRTYKKNKIWCAEISLEKRDGDEMWGKVEWFDIVLRVHTSCSLFYADVVSAAV